MAASGDALCGDALFGDVPTAVGCRHPPGTKDY